MRCPSCGAEARDPEAVFCARCGARMAPEDQPFSGYDPGPAPSGPTGVIVPEPPSEGAVTARPGPPDRPSIESPVGGYVGAGGTEPAGEAEARPPGTGPNSTSVPVREFAVAIRRSFVSGGWGYLAGAAAIGWLTLAGLGALIVVAAAIGSGGFGPGIDALDMLSLVVLFGLSVMGTSLEFSNLGPVVGPSFSMIWLGALAIFGFSLSWATARAVEQRRPPDTRAALIEGAKVAVPFALYCLLAALLFKITDVGTLSASAPQAFFLGLLWGAAFGALGGLRSRDRLPAIWARGLGGIRSRRRATYEGVSAGGIMLGATALTSAAAFLVLIIVALARGDSLDGLTIGSVIAALIVIALTLPNVLSLIAAVSLGAPLSLVTVALGERENVSLIGFGGRTSGSLVLLFLFIPLLSCLLGGFSAYRQSVDRSKVIEVLVAAACVYAGALSLLALLNGFSFEGGVEGVDVGIVRTNFVLVALLGLVWAGGLGFAGWKLAEMQDTDAAPSSNGGVSDRRRPGPPGYDRQSPRPHLNPDPAPPTTEHPGPPADS